MRVPVPVLTTTPVGAAEVPPVRPLIATLPGPAIVKVVVPIATPPPSVRVFDPLWVMAWDTGMVIGTLTVWAAEPAATLMPALIGSVLPPALLMVIEGAAAVKFIEFQV